jgi:drug/metabolite transporter (DMT)-like permease
MPLHVVALVLLAAVMHAVWNALVKTAGDSVLTMALVTGVASAAAGLLLPFVPPPAPASWGFLALSAVIHIGYFFFLLRAYQVGDLSHVYPVARGGAPLVVALGAALFASEPPTPSGLIGVLLLSAAIGSFAFERGRSARHSIRPFVFAFATATVIGVYTLIDGLGVRRAGSALGYVMWLLFVDMIPLAIYVLATRRDRIGPYLRSHWGTGVIGGLLCGTGYGVAIWALSVAPMAYVSALRETGVVFAALIGAVVLRESFGARRVLAALLVAVGVFLMNLPR